MAQQRKPLDRNLLERETLIRRATDALHLTGSHAQAAHDALGGAPVQALDALLADSHPRLTHVISQYQRLRDRVDPVRRPEPPLPLPLPPPTPAPPAVFIIFIEQPERPRWREILAKFLPKKS